MKKLIIFFGFLFSILLYSCSADEDLNMDQDKSSDVTLRGTSVTYIQNVSIPLRSYLIRNSITGGYNYLETTLLPSQLAYEKFYGIRFQVCKNRNSEANVAIYHVFNDITKDVSIAREDDILKPGQKRYDHWGYIYGQPKLGLVPLKEYYSDRNQNTRYIVFDSEIQEMQNNGEDFRYVRTLGYVCTTQYSCPRVEVIYTSKSTETYKLYYWQSVYGNPHHTDDMMINNSGGAAWTGAHLIGNKVIDFSFYKISDKTTRTIQEYVPAGSKVYINITESNDISVRVI